MVSEDLYNEEKVHRHTPSVESHAHTVRSLSHNSGVFEVKCVLYLRGQTETE